MPQWHRPAYLPLAQQELAAFTSQRQPQRRQAATATSVAHHLCKARANYEPCEESPYDDAGRAAFRILRTGRHAVREFGTTGRARPVRCGRVRPVRWSNVTLAARRRDPSEDP